MTKLVFSFCLLFLSFFPSTSDAGGPRRGVVGLVEYIQIRSVAEDLERKFPIKKYHYVAIGRSPTPLMAYFNEKGVETSFLPLSKFTYLDQNQNVSEAEWDSKRKKLFKNHVLANVPKDKKLLFIDYVNTGESLRCFVHFMDSQLKLDYKIAGMVLTGNKPALNAIKAVNGTALKISLNDSYGSPFARRVAAQFYDMFSPSPRFDLRTERAPCAVMEASGVNGRLKMYQLLRDSLGVWMANEKEDETPSACAIM